MVRRSGGQAVLSRRGFFLTAAGLLVATVRPTDRLTAQTPDSLPGSGAGRLWDPARAGRPLDPVVARDNDAAIQAIEKQLRCTCGCGLDVYTCRTTDFTCTTSPEMHRQVLALADQGKTAQQIVDSFVKDNGIAILMAPPRRGFNLAGYFVPSLAIVAAGVLLLLVLRRWTREAEPAAVTPPPPPDASPAELDRLRRELEQFTD